MGAGPQFNILLWGLDAYASLSSAGVCRKSMQFPAHSAAAHLKNLGKEFVNTKMALLLRRMCTATRPLTPHVANHEQAA